MDSNVLIHSVARSKDGNLSVIAWYMEFYSAGYSCLHPGSYLLRSVGKPFTNDGLVDFYVSSEQWAVELLIGGSTMKEHIRRFEDGGSEFRDFDLNNKNNVDPKINKIKENAESDAKIFAAISTVTGIIGVTGAFYMHGSSVANSVATEKEIEAKVLDGILNEKKELMEAKSEKRIIEQFESTIERGARPSKLFIRRFEEQWKEIIEECKGNFFSVSSEEIPM
nr:10714_t:CDS:2 [Entrophospora candida]